VAGSGSTTPRSRRWSNRSKIERHAVSPPAVRSCDQRRCAPFARAAATWAKAGVARVCDHDCTTFAAPYADAESIAPAGNTSSGSTTSRR
jgi:hypothetical protein